RALLRAAEAKADGEPVLLQFVDAHDMLVSPLRMYIDRRGLVPWTECQAILFIVLTYRRGELVAGDDHLRPFKFLGGATRSRQFPMPHLPGALEQLQTVLRDRPGPRSSIHRVVRRGGGLAAEDKDGE